jgi:hypothetical protein
MNTAVKAAAENIRNKAPRTVMPPHAQLLQSLATALQTNPAAAR